MVQVQGVALDNSKNLYLVASWSPNSVEVYQIFKYGSNGTLVWSTSNPDASCASAFAHQLAVDATGCIYVTGQSCYIAPHYAYATFIYGTYKANSNGSWIWTNTFPPSPVQPSISTSLALDSANNSYITGFSPGPNSSNDVVTIKYGPNGNQVWLQRYHGPGSGNDAGNAIAVDNNGNVYVTGYEATAAGGTEIVTIKYAAITLQKLADGSFLLEAQGSPGESFDIQASADLQTWLDLGSAIADTNGLMQFADTNAPNYPARFYYTNPQ
jgi:hypothetical protein